MTEKDKALFLLITTAIALIGSPAIAAFFEDFESSPDITAAPWSYAHDGPPYLAAGMGTNTSVVTRMPDFCSQNLALSSPDRYEQGSLEFDYYQSVGFTRIHLTCPHGWLIAQFHIWGNVGGSYQELALNTAVYTTVAEAADLVPPSTWNSYKLDWDTSTQTLSVSFNGTPVPELQNISAMEPGHDFSGETVNEIRFYAYTATINAQFDNVSVMDKAQYEISGNVAIAGVAMSGLPGEPVLSTGDGSYTTNVLDGWSGTVTPTLAGYTFSPAQKIYSGVTQDYLNEDYTLYCTISGNAGTEGVLMAGLPGDPVTSQADGSYSGLVAKGWSGTVTPTKYSYTFSPTDILYSNVAQNYPNQDYSPMQLLNHIIGGNVGLGGITLVGMPDTTVSAADGSYSGSVLVGWSGTVTPTHAWYSFSPISKSYSNVTADNAGENYTITGYSPPSIQTVPAAPNSLDTIQVTLAGTWPDDLPPTIATAAFSDPIVYFDIFDTTAVGNAVATPMAVTSSIGPLPPGVYDIYAALLPETYNLPDWISALTPAEAASFGLDFSQFQTDLDAAGNMINTTNLDINRTLADLYKRGVVDLYNETIVNIGFLKDETESLKRAILYADTVVDTSSAALVAVQCDANIASALTDAGVVLDDFCSMFVTKLERDDPVAVLNLVVQDPAKLQVLKDSAQTISNFAALVADSRRNVADELRRLRNDPAFKSTFTKFQRYVLPELPPVTVASDGTLERIIFAGPWGRTETMLSLGFDTLDEPGTPYWNSYPDDFTRINNGNAKWQKIWDDYQVTAASSYLMYALGDSMYRPDFFLSQFAPGGVDNPDFYFMSSGGYVGTGGFDYRHPVPRAMILEYLEGAANYCSTLPFTFMYKGPWEAHPTWTPAWPLFQEHGFSVPAVAAFRDYLQDKYGTIANLNTQWQSSYAGFSSISLPIELAFQLGYYTVLDERGVTLYFPYYPRKRLPGASTTPLTYEFERCRKDLYMEFFADCYTAIKTGDPCRPLGSSTSGGIMNEVIVNSIDDLLMAENCVDMWGKHPSGGVGWADSPYLYGLNHYFNKTLVALEYYGYGQNEFGDEFYGTFQIPSYTTPEKLYNASRRDVWHEYGWDRKMLLFYWPEKLTENKLPPGGQNWVDGIMPDTSPMLQSWSSFVPVVKRRTTNLNDILMNVPIVKPKIGVLHAGVSIINAYPTDSVAKVTEDIFDRLIAMQYHFGVVAEEFIVSDRDSLDNYEVIILPYVQYFDDGFAAKLLNWVSNGGTLISTGPFGLYNKLGFASSDAATLVYPGATFSYADPGYPLGWIWQASGSPSFTNGYNISSYGSGTIMTTLDGRALYRPGIGIAEGSKRTTRPPASDIVDPGGYSPAQQAFYDTLAATQQRKAWVTSGNVEMVIRQAENGQGPLYISLLNWDYNNTLDTSVVVNGEYTIVTDLSIQGSFPVPAAVAGGQTTLPMKLGPGEGLMLRLEN